MVLVQEVQDALRNHYPKLILFCKCDETRPSCITCETIGRRCSYLDEYEASSNLPTSSIVSPDDASAGPSTQLNLVDPISTAAATAQLRLSSLPFELIYVELLQQWLNETHQSFVYNNEQAQIFGPVTLNHALAWPFLMHALLAYSSLHLGSTSSEKSMDYQHRADELLGIALLEFNAILPRLNSTSITAAFLFSNITSAHQMSKYCSAKIDVFEESMDRFIDCLRVCRGVNIIIENWWEALQESELKPILTCRDGVTAGQDMEKHTPEFDSVRDLIRTLDSTNSPDAITTYLSALQSIQGQFNVQCALDSPELNRSTSWAFAWPMTISSDFVDLLKARRPEALVVLAHYTPLLHYRRTSWAIGDAGFVMFGLIESSLGQKWVEWLHWPRQVFSTT